MKKIILFHLQYCGFCREARQYLDEILQKHPEYRSLEIELVEEAQQRERARTYDYYYVPTFYLGSQKIHEGPVNRRQVESILQQAYADNISN